MVCLIYSASEISNKYSKGCVYSSHTYNLCYLYAFILISILYAHYSYSKFKELIVFIISNTHDVVGFDSPSIEIYMRHNISLIRIRTLQYSVEGSVLAVLLSFFFICKCSNKIIHFVDK